ncbi:MAG: RNA polymerase sigma factor [Candidatus Nanopelagicales bacterium]
MGGTPTHDPTDAELLRRVAAADESALEVLVQRHAAWLTLRLRHRMGDPDVVQEVLQDTFVAVWRSAGSWRGDGEVAAWIWGIAIRRLVSLLRGRRESAVPASDAALDGALSPVESAEDQVLVAVEHGDLGTALNRLSPELRQVVQATLIDGLSTREAGQLLGIPQGTVKGRLRAAKSTLRAGLTPVRRYT